MNKKAVTILLFAMVLSGGMFFRLWRLADRPMHTDESVHAEKFKALLENGFYKYDPDEFHGPTLNYFTLFSAWLRCEKSYTDINELTLRFIPAVFGIVLILTPLFFLKVMSRRAVLFSCVLIAFSPAFVYYSRYYIQEMLLVFFTTCFLGCLCNYLISYRLRWLVLSGVSVGLMHATKETFIFSVAAAAVAIFVGILSRDIQPRVKILHIICSLAAMLLVSAMFYSSFGSNPGGIVDSVKTYFIWGLRAGQKGAHVHRWYFYLNLLTGLKFNEPVFWNEDGILALAIFGFFFAFKRRTTITNNPVIRLIAIYALTLTAIYCLIPYKTPWCLLSFLYAMILLSGFATDHLIKAAKTTLNKYCVGILVFIFVIASPIAQSWFLNFSYAAESTNPYAYSQTDTDIFKMVGAVRKAACASKDGRQTLIYVIADKDDYWPLPWYLRDFSRVGYWGHVDNSACQVPIILINTAGQADLQKILYSVPEPGQKHLYFPLFDEPLYLRPGVEWQGYIRKELWDRMQDNSEPVSQAIEENKKVLESPADGKIIQNLVKFSHRAMNTNFEIFIQHKDSTYAAQAAGAGFNEVDRLEAIFSRYIKNSDVSRINDSPVAEEVLVDEDTIKCLQIARRAYYLTDGAFNIAIGNLIEARKRGDNKYLSYNLSHLPTPEMLEINAENYTVKITHKQVNIDLGGLGKGYAIDAAAKILTDWGIKKAMIHSGTSSVRALDAPTGKTGWPVIIRNPLDESVVVRLELVNEALSCSGLQRGGHIINPFTGQPVTDRRACWIRTKESAALADALTTAGMIMPVSSIKTLHNELPEISVMLMMNHANQSGKIIPFGNWPIKDSQNLNPR